MIKRNILHKIKSEAGASLVAALLLFLVCAAIGTIVLVSATTASGRFVSLAEMDKKYYSVTSAAEFMIDHMEGNEIVIERTKTPTATEGVYTYTTSVDGLGLNSMPADYQKRQAVTLLFGTNDANFNGESAYNASFGLDSDYTENNLTAVFSGGEGGKYSDTVNISSTLKSNGNIEMTLTSTDNDGTGKYKVVITFTFINSESTYTKVESVGSAEVGSTVKKNVVRWVVDSVKKVGASS